MDERKQELKILKKAYKRVKRRKTLAWRILTVFFLILSILMVPLTVAAIPVGNTVTAYLGGSLWTAKNAGEALFLTDFTDAAAMETYRAGLAQRAAEEGLVLLTNRQQSLPLETGASLRCVGAEATSLNQALADAGFAVTDSAAVALAVLPGTAEAQVQELVAAKKAGTVQTIIVLLTGKRVPGQWKVISDVADACLWIGETDNFGVSAVAKVLSGGVMPSGRLANTLGYQPEADWMNGSVYSGYKYYETRYEDYVRHQENAGEFLYDELVAFPFGSGLSYTQFAYSDLSVEEVGDTLRVSVKVTNQGKRFSGKETVQIYYQSPYTDYDREYGIEKPAVALCGYAKTGVLEPGSSETVTVIVDKKELVSYDAFGAGTYILEAGDYYLAAAANAHDAVNHILRAKGSGIRNSQNRMDADGNEKLAYLWQVEKTDTVTYSVSNNGTTIENLLTGQTKTEGVSRVNWEESLAAPPQLYKKDPVYLPAASYVPNADAGTELPVMGATNGVTLWQMTGVAYDDLMWNTFLDQLSFLDMARLLGDSAYWRLPLLSVQAPGVRIGGYEEPWAQTVTLPQTGSMDTAVASFNPELMYELGKMLGNDCLQAKIACLYETANCTEDGFLSGVLMAEKVRGLSDKGVGVLLKNTAVKATGDVKNVYSVQMSEQAARETYLKAFMEPVREVGAGVALPAVCWGGSAAEGYAGLTGVIREWSKLANVVLEHGAIPVVHGADGALAGIAAFDSAVPFGLWQLWAYQNDPAVVTAMRETCHRYFYWLANSSAMNGFQQDTSVFFIIPEWFCILGIATLSAIGLCLIFWILLSVGKASAKRSEACQNYRQRRAEIRAEIKAEKKKV